MNENLENYKAQKKELYERIKNFLTYTGTALAIISAIVYLILVYIIIYGFEVSYSKTQLLMFIILGAVVGILINVSMRMQGLDFAKLNPNAKRVLNELTRLKGVSNEVKLRPVWVMFLTTLLKDIIIKGGTIGMTIYFTIDISYNGLGEEKYFWLALANIVLYFGLGLISMSKAYDYYLDSHIPYMEQKIKKLKKGIDKHEGTTSRDKDED